MEIGWPTDVRHVAHVTFDRFHGFLGLPVEFEPVVPRRAPSASAKGRLYDLGGLQTEGIFRITADNSQENHVRDQLNCGKLPANIDVHCLAGLIKAWFRELPTGVLDSLSSEKVMQCRTEEDCAQLAKLLPPSECALLDWAINLMADVVNEEQHNKMNAHNVATVFAPNMTQMADPLTALMYAVQVMNFLRLLILKTLKERQKATLQDQSAPNTERSDDNAHSNSQLHNEDCSQTSKKAMEEAIVPNELVCINLSIAPQEESSSHPGSTKTSHANVVPVATATDSTNKRFCENSHGTDGSSNVLQLTAANSNAIHIKARTAC